MESKKPMKKLLLIPLFLLCISAFGQFTKPELYTNINTNIRLKTYSPTRLASLLDSLVATMGSGSGMVYPGAGIPLSTGSAWGTSITDNSTLWNNAIAKTGTTTLTGNTSIQGSGSGYNFKIGDVSEIGDFSLSASGTINLSRANSQLSLSTSTGDLRNASRVFYVTPASIEMDFEATKVLRFETAGTTLNIGSDATGDTYQRNASGYFSRLAAVSAGSFLRSGGVATVNSWSTVKLPDTMSALGLWVANSANTTVNLTATAGQSVRVNAGGTAWEAYTPGTGAIGGSTGSVDNSVLRADGTGGATLQASQVSISDTGDLTMGTDATTARFITATGSATDVGLGIDGKGQGTVVINGTNSTGNTVLNGTEIQLYPNTIPTTTFFQTAATNTVVTSAILTATSSGTSVAGFGTGLSFRSETGASNQEDGSVIESVLTDATGASEDFDLLFKTMAAGATATEKLRVKSTGQAQLASYTTSSSFTGTPVGYLQFDASGNILTASNGVVDDVVAGTTLTLDDADNGKLIYFTSGSAITVTLPSGLMDGFYVMLVQDNTGAISVTTSGTTLNGTTSTSAQYDVLTLTNYKATNTYIGK